MDGTLQIAAQQMDGKLIGSDAPFSGVSTDSRLLTAGELFIALHGPNFDGSKFVAMAADKGAAGAVVQEHGQSDLPQIVVTDTRKALGKLARCWRASLPTTVVGVTGSNGKTTLKEMIAACLSQLGATHATRGNFNNDIGLPLMVFELNAAHRFAVLEMGANHKGEIAYLTSIAQPQVAVISNAGPAHLEGFGSLDGVAAAKGELLAADLVAAVLNADDKYFSYWVEQAEGTPVLSFGLGPHADVYADKIELRTAGSQFELHAGGETLHVNLNFVGEHNVLNACGAAAVASALGADLQQIKKGLESARPVGGRLRVVAGVNDCTIYDDSYNANPTSIIAAAKFLVTLPGQSWLVLGDMGELGANAVALHADLGRVLGKVGVDRLFVCGELMRNTAEAFGRGAHWFDDKSELIDALREAVVSTTNLLIKGSRLMRMEEIVAALQVDAVSAGDKREAC